MKISSTLYELFNKIKKEVEKSELVGADLLMLIMIVDIGYFVNL